jgi:hypothetical protein
MVENRWGVGLVYVPELLGTVVDVGAVGYTVRRAKPAWDGALVERRPFFQRAFRSREAAEAWCRVEVSPYGPSLGRGGMSVPGNGWSASRD